MKAGHSCRMGLLFGSHYAGHTSADAWAQDRVSAVGSCVRWNSLPRQRVTLASAPCESVPALSETLFGRRGFALSLATCSMCMFIHLSSNHMYTSYYYCALPSPRVFLLRARRKSVAGASGSPAEACIVVSLLVPYYWVCASASRHSCWARCEGRL